MAILHCNPVGMTNIVAPGERTKRVTRGKNEIRLEAHLGRRIEKYSSMRRKVKGEKSKRSINAISGNKNQDDGAKGRRGEFDNLTI